ncbi:hypothetical protein [Pelolinea submarina]|uniref:Uncharacterized protein n=1 Tax=Pelolinea submarina TaxID=913107 RepID=A0A347ZUB4_9CHLR|nr:hypothetical protein [Pelolinea submarina]REG10520.1 hypothetical protein DFR64_0379 [Pelolinea submarina]BBB48895.1 hypothetical protein Pelsub_P2126 [Pelolinea submarina]
MTKNRSLNHIPKTHTIKKNTAEEIFNLVYPGSDKEFKKTKVKEIENWLAEGYFFGNENPVELAREWQEYSQD